MTKEEKIKEAWGERYEIYKDFIDENGWIENRYLGFSNFVLTEPFEKDYRGGEDEEFDYGKIIFRPIALSNE